MHHVIDLIECVEVVAASPMETFLQHLRRTASFVHQAVASY